MQLMSSHLNAKIASGVRVNTPRQITFQKVFATALQVAEAIVPNNHLRDTGIEET